MGRRITCPRCDGNGWYRNPTDRKTARSGCTMCDGKGEIVLEPGSEVCDRCNGKMMLWSQKSDGGLTAR